MVLDMRGLQSFISEIRKAGNDQEKVYKRISKELAKIRKAFQKSNKLKGYDRKKYVCKLLYVYMMGYEIDFGHIEAVNLLSSDKYSEKHIGYLACTLLLNEGHELVTLITHSMKRDLTSKQPFHQALALTAIANIGGQDQAEVLAQDVQKLLVASDTHPDVRKKAALTLLKLYRKFPEIMVPEEWAGRVSNLLQGMNLGVSTSVMSLVLALAADHPYEYVETTSKVIQLISKLILQQNEFHKKYMYYGIRAPWLQIKLFRLLQYFPCPEDPAKIKIVMDAIDRLIAISKRFMKSPGDRKSSVSRINALHAVLFEAINLAIHYDQDSRLLVEIANLLGRFLDDRDTNLRYISLDTLSRLAFSEHENVIEAIRRKQNTILLSLKDPDISIRRRALDLLYSMCNTSNAEQIVGELLDYTTIADYAIREELVLKIAILAEKYATDLEWYVDVMLSLVSQSGDFATPEVWYRIVQVVTNAENEELSRYAASTVFQTVSEPSAHERCIQVSAYLLGEFGYLIANKPKSSPIEQFRVLLTKFQTTTPVTKCIILNSFMKFYNLYEDPSLRVKIKNLFKRLTDHADPEIQQRAIEYYQLTQVDDATMQSCLEQMPPFPERVGEASILIEMIKKREAVSSEKGVRKRKHHEDVESSIFKKGAKGSGMMMDLKRATSPQEEQKDEGDLYLDDVLAQNGEIDLLDDLLGIGSFTSSAPPTTQTTSTSEALGGLDLDSLMGGSSYASQQSINPYGSMGAMNMGAMNMGAMNMGVPPVQQPLASPFDDPFGSILDVQPVTSPTEPVVQQGPIIDEDAQKQAVVLHKALTIQNKGVAIESEKLQIALESEFHGFEGRIKLMYGNKTPKAIEKVRFTYEPISELSLEFSQNSPLITGDAQISQYVKIVCKRPFKQSVEFSLYFEHQRQDYRVNIVLPIHVHKFITPLHYDLPEQFFESWNQIQRTPGKEIQEIFKASGEIDLKVPEKVLKGHGFSIMKHIDPKPTNYVCAGVFHSRDAGDEVVLVRLECNLQKQAYRLTVRCNEKNITEEIASRVKSHLEEGIVVQNA